MNKTALEIVNESFEKIASKAFKDFEAYNHEANDLSQEDYARFIQDVRKYDPVINDMNIKETKRDKSNPLSYGFALDATTDSGKASLDRIQRFLPDGHLMKDLEPGKRNVRSPRSKEVSLHEIGHMMDYSKNSAEYGNQRKRNKPNAITGTILPSVGNAAMMTALPTKAGAIGSVINTGANAAYEGYKGYKDGRLTQLQEDRANQFAMKYLTDKYGGDRDKAQQHFNNSALPIARRTYDNLHKTEAVRRGARPIIMGGLGATYGMATRR